MSKKKKSLIIDASCIMAVIKQESTAQDVMEKSEGYQLLSAACLPFEVGNSLSKWLKRNLMTKEAAIKCFELYRKLPIALLDVDFETSLSYAADEKHYAYDMYYLECALRTGCPLLTYDEDLSKIAKKRGVVCL